MAMLRGKLVVGLLSTVIAFWGAGAWGYVDPEDQKLIDAADCDELVREYRNHLAGEKKIADEIQRSRNSTTASNVIGLAALATLGIGFFHPKNSSSDHVQCIKRGRNRGSSQLNPVTWVTMNSQTRCQTEATGNCSAVTFHA